MQFLLLNRNEEFIGYIDTVDQVETECLNSDETLEFKTIYPGLEKGFRILYKDELEEWHEYIIQSFKESHTQNDEIVMNVYCENSFYETLTDYIEDKRPSKCTATAALEQALETSRWEAGKVEDLGLNSTMFYRCSVKDAVQNKILGVWGGEISTTIEVEGNQITRRLVNIHQKRGDDNGKRFEYRKDIQEIEREISIDDVITALYGYGKGEEIEETGGYGRRIDFADINNGKAYVENNEARLIYGRNSKNGKVHKFGKIEFSEVTDKAELLKLTKEKLAEISKPRITYSAKVIDLSKLGYGFERVRLGDTVTVIDKELNISVRARVIKLVKHLDYDILTEVTLGNFIETTSDLFLEAYTRLNNFKSKEAIWDNVAKKFHDGVDSNLLKNIIDKLNEEINASGGYVYISEDGEGLITYDKPKDKNPTKAIQIMGGAIRIANKKNSNGEWDWSTFGTGDGFAANEIITGILKGGNVNFNLNDGTLLIGESIDNYFLYFDGSTLKWGSGSINSDNLSNELKNELKGKDGKNFKYNLISNGNFFKDEILKEKFSNQNKVFNKWRCTDSSLISIEDKKVKSTTNDTILIDQFLENVSDNINYYLKFKARGKLTVYIKYIKDGFKTFYSKIVSVNSDEEKEYISQFIFNKNEYAGIELDIRKKDTYITDIILSEEPITEETKWYPSMYDSIGVKGDKGEPGKDGTLAELPGSLLSWAGKAVEIGGQYIYTPELFVGTNLSSKYKTGIYIGKNVNVQFNGTWQNLSGLMGLVNGEVKWIFTDGGDLRIGTKWGETISLGADGRAIIPEITTDKLLPGSHERIVMERGYSAGENNCKSIDANYDGIRMKANSGTYYNARKSETLEMMVGGILGMSIKKESWNETHPANSNISNWGDNVIRAVNSRLQAGWVLTVGISSLSDISKKENVKFLDSDFVYRQNTNHEITNISVEEIQAFIKNARIATYNFKGFNIDNISVIAQSILSNFKNVSKYLIHKTDNTYSINQYAYISMIHVAIQENMKKIEELEKENILKDKKIEELENRLKKLENTILAK